MRAGVLRIGFDGAHERVARVRKAFQLHQHQAHAVPRRRGGRLVGQDLAIGLERQLEAAQMGQQQREIEPRADELRRELQRLPEALDGVFRVALVREDDADVVPRQRVPRIDFRRVPVGRERVRRLAGLMQHDAALVPELGRIGDLVDQRFVDLERIGEVALEEMDFGHRLAHQLPILAAFDREPILPQRLRVVALLPEREPEIVVRQLARLRDLGRGLVAQPLLGRFTLRAIAFQRKIRLRAGEWRIELNRALRCGAGVLMPPHVAQHERHQVVRVGIVRVERDGSLERGQRRLVQPAIVVDLAEIEVYDRRIGLLFHRAQQPFGRHLQPPAGLLGEAELDDRGHILRPVGQQLLEFRDGVFVGGENRVRAPHLPARVAIVGRAAELFLELGDAAVVVAGVVIRDLEIALRDLHARIELERARELFDRLGDEALLVVEDAQIVVRPRIRRIDPAGKRAEDREVTLGNRRSRRRHGQLRRMASKMALRDARSGRSRKWPRSPSRASMLNSVSTQNTKSRS